MTYLYLEGTLPPNIQDALAPGFALLKALPSFIRAGGVHKELEEGDLGDNMFDDLLLDASERGITPALFRISPEIDFFVRYQQPHPMGGNLSLPRNMFFRGLPVRMVPHLFYSAVLSSSEAFQVEHLERVAPDFHFVWRVRADPKEWVHYQLTKETRKKGRNP